ncbi:MAG: archease [Streptosporangiales bacterium]|nr:archease [Streptosporangiales bacterium]
MCNYPAQGGGAVTESEDLPLSGHQVLPHTADVALAAWAPSRAECIAEAVRALVESFADVTDAAPGGSIAFPVEPEGDDDLLVSVLDEAIYQIEVHDRVPVDVEVAEDSDGGGIVRFATVPTDSVEPVGAIPKGVSWHDLQFGCSGGTWRCHVTVDV